MIRMTIALTGTTLLGATAAMAQMTTPGASGQSMSGGAAQSMQQQRDTQQEQDMQQQQPSTPDQAAPAGSATLTNADVSDADVGQFATAVLAVQKIQADSSVAAADKQKSMADAVQQAGMTPQKFNAIAQASQSDPALMKRIQTAAASPSPREGSG